MQIGAATMENSTEVLQKTKNKTSRWPSNYTPGYVSEKKKQNETTNFKDIRTTTFTALFTLAKKWKKPKCP